MKKCFYGMVTGLALCAANFLTLNPSAHAWGELGHETVAAIAWDRLSESAKNQITAILDPNETLEDASTWADRIRSDESWDFIKPYHYVETLPDQSYLDHDHSENGDVVRAIFTYANILKKPVQDRIETRNAIRFLVHFVGDLHQPLHASFTTGALAGTHGGNSIKVEFLPQVVTNSDKKKKKKWSLHQVWDSKIIDHDYKQNCPKIETYAVCIKKSDSYAAWIKDVKQLTAVEWSSEVTQYLDGVMKIKDNTIDDEYLKREIPVARKLLVTAGVRLARQLETALALADAANEEKTQMLFLEKFKTPIDLPTEAK
jgi:hypothetical protein